MCERLSPFVMGIDDLSPWDRLAQSGHADQSMRLRYVMCLYLGPFPICFSFYVNLNAFVYVLVLQS